MVRSVTVLFEINGHTACPRARGILAPLDAQQVAVCVAVLHTELLSCSSLTSSDASSCQCYLSARLDMS
jgi:hypothetical protein